MFQKLNFLEKSYELKKDPKMKIDMDTEPIPHRQNECRLKHAFCEGHKYQRILLKMRIIPP